MSTIIKEPRTLWCAPIGLLLIIAGGCMFGMCKNAHKNGNCDGNESVADTGIILLIIGGCLEGLVLLSFLFTTRFI